MLSAYNRKLLTSVYTPQEAREAVLGGARIIDSEDPKSALGNISPLRIMAISDAALDYARDLDVQLSTNIGEDQLIFRRSPDGRAVEKSARETAGKAAQAALGVAISMGTRVHPSNIVKVGLDGMPSWQLEEVLTEVVNTLRRTPLLSQTQVMSVLFANDLSLWRARRADESVRRQLVTLREFVPADGDSPDAFDLRDYLENIVKTDGSPQFEKPKEVSLAELHRLGVLPSTSTTTFVRLNEPVPHGRFFGVEDEDKTTREVITKMVDVTARARADAMMLDTSVLYKICNVGLVDSSSAGMKNLSQFIIRQNLDERGILSLDDIRFFVDYCHYRGIVANIAGSIESFQAQQIWVQVPDLDQLSARGCASAALRDPATMTSVDDTRQRRVITRRLVRGLAPPEHGGVLNIPSIVQESDKGMAAVQDLQRDLSSLYRDAGQTLRAFFVKPDGSAQEIREGRGVQG